MKEKLLEPVSNVLVIGYHPDSEPITENPPRFTWMPEDEEDRLTYELQVCSNPEFTMNYAGNKDRAETVLITVEDIRYNYTTLSQTLPAGHYYWRYTINPKKYTYSKVREFDIAENLPETPLKTRAERYQNAEMSHPRLWMNQKEIAEFRQKLETEGDYCGFHKFMEESVLSRLDDTFVKEPPRYPEDRRVVALWRQNYQQCEEAMEYIRSFAVAGMILEKPEYMRKAIDGALELTTWDLEGPTNRNYNDECSFRVVYALAFAFDWLYDFMESKEKKQILNCLFWRTNQIAHHIIAESRVHLSMYDSHAVRSLSSVITPCCIAMLGENAEAQEWLDYAIEYFNVIYTPWGGIDGGWAEGGLYWTTGMAFVIDALNVIKKFMGIDIYKRPFFQRTGDFPLYCMPVDTCRASFCDQSNLGKYPGYKTAFNMRQFAGITGNANYMWYYDKVLEREKVPDPDFFNKGWWDFAYDDMVFRHDYGTIPMKKQKLEPVKWFHDVGWVAINHNMQEPENHIFLLTKSSRYGSVSHSHGDQNSFVIFAFGEPLIIESGHYVGFNTTMHRAWRKQTKSTNTILINGQGQYASYNKECQLSAKGKICSVTEQENRVTIREDATAAYLENVPSLVSYVRTIHFIDQSYFMIEDEITTQEPSEIEWLLHSVYPFQIDDMEFVVEGEKAKLCGKIVSCSSGVKNILQDNVFEGVEPEELEGLENQWHFKMTTGKACSHKIVSVLHPAKKDRL